MFQWITGVIAAFGYLGIAGLMLAENVFPPIPSELIMPLAGYMAAQGQFSLVWLILAGTAGSVIGAVLWYWIGLKIGLERLVRSHAATGAGSGSLRATSPARNIGSTATAGRRCFSGG
ncbi:hypothetical protein [Thioclava pacifica]|uniref:DedA family protein n=1 Tax=Thioclava pacifica TaxID=285109 RepID=UPI000A92CF9D